MEDKMIFGHLRQSFFVLLMGACLLPLSKEALCESFEDYSLTNDFFSVDSGEFQDYEYDSFNESFAEESLSSNLSSMDADNSDLSLQNAYDNILGSQSIPTLDLPEENKIDNSNNDFNLNKMDNLLGSDSGSSVGDFIVNQGENLLTDFSSTKSLNTDNVIPPPITLKKILAPGTLTDVKQINMGPLANEGIEEDADNSSFSKEDFGSSDYGNDWTDRTYKDKQILPCCFVNDDEPPHFLLERFDSVDNRHLSRIKMESEYVNMLLQAIEYGDFISVSRLLDNVGPDSKTASGESLLFSAIKAGSPRIVRLMLARGASVDDQNVSGLTPIEFAKRRGRHDLVDIMQKMDPNPFGE